MVSFDKRYQRGSSLIEALIGSLLMGIIFVGLMTVLSRTLVSQRYMNAQNNMLLDMHGFLQTQGLNDICTNGAGDLNIGGRQVPFDAATCQSPVVTVTALGIAVDVAAGTLPALSVSLSTTANDDTASLFGGDGVMTFSY